VSEENVKIAKELAMTTFGNRTDAIAFILAILITIGTLILIHLTFRATPEQLALSKNKSVSTSLKKYQCDTCKKGFKECRESKCR
jgi:Flp pilus assembly protein protease CpaA